MVDFNNINTVATPAVDIVRIIILNRWYDLQEAIEDYNKHCHNNRAYTTSIIKARAWTLFYCIGPMLKRRPKAQDDLIGDYDRVKNHIEKSEIIEALLLMTVLLDEINLIKIDTRRNYDRTRVEQANEAAGY